MRDHYDVVVVGGGVAGCATAVALQQHGLSTVVLERSTGARLRIGEHLAPSARPWLDRLGLTARFLNDAHRRSPGLRVCWGRDRLGEREYICDPHGDGWNVDRPRFEAMFTSAVLDAGGRIVQQGSARTLIPSDAGWLIDVGMGDQRHGLEARFVVDATGRTASVARRLGACRDVDDRLVGVIGSMEPTPDADLVDATLLIEAVPGGWWYAALLPDDRLAAVFMADAPACPTRAMWLTQLSRTEYVKVRAAGFRLAGNVYARFAGGAISTPAAGRRWIAVGDAAVAFDPLSSMGISHALQSAVEAADVIRYALHGAGNAVDDYVARIERTYAAYLAARRQHYAGEGRWHDERFWRTRN